MTQMGRVHALSKGSQGVSAAFHGKRSLFGVKIKGISWLRDESLQSGENLPEPDEIAAGIMVKLQTAMEEMEALTALLERDADAVEIENKVSP